MIAEPKTETCRFVMTIALGPHGRFTSQSLPAHTKVLTCGNGQLVVSGAVQTDPWATIYKFVRACGKTVQEETIRQYTFEPHDGAPVSSLTQAFLGVAGVVSSVLFFDTGCVGVLTTPTVTKDRLRDVARASGVLLKRVSSR